MGSLGNNRGVAILVALFAMIFLLVIATEVSYDTNVEYVVAAQKVNRIKAYYAAKSGVELSLFRIMLYKKAMASFGDQVKGNPQGQNLINQIWQFPFAWPPIMPPDIDPVAQDEIDTALEESFMDAQYNTIIKGEGGKLDLNDLGSPSEEIANATKAAVLAIFESEMENNEDFEDKYSNENFEELVNNIADWVDDDSEGRNNRSEDQVYEQPEDTNLRLPPNRAFRTMEELHIVAGMNDDFYKLLSDRVTVYGSKGVNPNSASQLVLKSLDPQIDEEVVGKVIERRSNMEKGGPFRDDDDFFGFLQSLGVNTGDIEDLEIPFYYDAEYNFRIVSTGKFANVIREITAISFDVENLSERYGEFLKKVGNPSTTPTPTPTDGSSNGSSGTKFKEVKGRPVVVYWEEN